MSKGDLKLIAVFLLFCGAIAFRIAVNNNKYVTPDSKHYLRSAKNFNDNKGFITPEIFPFNGVKNEKRLAMWPVGYPFCIAITSKFTGIPLRWASKLVNLLFFGLTLLLLRKLFGDDTWFVALAFFGLTSLEIFSFTWSEGPFIFCSTLFAFILTKWDKLKLKWVYLALCLILSFTIRYAGVIYFFQVATIIGILAFRKSWKTMLPYILGAGIASLFVVFYLLYNKEHNGLITGMDRFSRVDENITQYFVMLLKGIFNEFFIIRNYYFLNEPISLFVVSSFIQLSLCMYLFRIKKVWQKVKWSNIQDKPSLLLIATGLFYLIGIIIIRFIIIFDPLDYRILSPASILILIGLLGLITKRIQYFSKVKLLITLFFILSLLLNLPKEYLLHLFY